MPALRAKHDVIMTLEFRSVTNDTPFKSIFMLLWMQ